MNLNNYDIQRWFCQVRTVGLIEAVVRFGQTFSGKPSESLHTQRTRSVWRQLEDNFLLCFTVSVPWVKKPAKDGGAEVMKQYNHFLLIVHLLKLFISAGG